MTAPACPPARPRTRAARAANPLDVPVLAAAERVYLRGEWATAGAVAAELGMPGEYEKIYRRVGKLAAAGAWPYPVPPRGVVSNAVRREIEARAGREAAVTRFELVATRRVLRRRGLMAEGLTPAGIDGAEGGDSVADDGFGVIGVAAGAMGGCTACRRVMTLRDACRAYLADWRVRGRRRRAERAAGTWSVPRPWEPKGERGKRDAKRAGDGAAA